MTSSFISKVYAILSDLFFPQTCLFCKTGGSICCQKCFADIPQKIRLENNILSLYHFSEPKINKLIWQLKYHHGGDIAKLFGSIVAEKLEKILFPIFPPTTQNIYLIPIPLNQSDKRLHNHAELLAREIQKCSPSLTLPNREGTSAQEHFRANIFVLSNLLIKNSKQKQSHTKGRQERFENIKGAFSVNQSSYKNFTHNPNNIYILIDDVTTSGATIAEARKTLTPFLNLPESEIYALTVAY